MKAFAGPESNLPNSFKVTKAKMKTIGLDSKARETRKEES